MMKRSFCFFLYSLLGTAILGGSCDTIPGSDPSKQPEGASFTCFSSALNVQSGGFNGSDFGDCNQPASSSSIIPGSSSTTDVSMSQSNVLGSTMLTLTCTLDIVGGPLTTPVDCDGQMSVVADFVSGGRPFHEFGIRVRSTTSGPAPDAFGVSVSSDCENQGVFSPLSTTGTTYFRTSQTQSKTCFLDVQMSGAASLEGLTIFSVSIYMPKVSCTFDDDCPDGSHCGSSQLCQVGLPGDPCSASADCSPQAPFCGPTGACQTGLQGDPCEGNYDCALNPLAPLFCSPAAVGTIGSCEPLP